MKKISIVILLALIFTLVFAVAPASATCGDCCECCGECEAATPGYWKNHPDVWPVEELQIGEVLYAKAELIELLSQPVKGDKSITLFKALVAAKLSIKSCPEVDACKSWILPYIYSGDYWMQPGNFPVGSGLKAKSDAWQDYMEPIYWVLDDFNNGLLCAPHRD